MIGWPHSSFIHFILSTRRGPHVTITHDALDFTVKRPFPLLPPDMGPHLTGPPSTSALAKVSPTSDSNLLKLDLTVQGPRVMTFGGEDWIPLQTCSL